LDQTDHMITTLWQQTLWQQTLDIFSLLR
jgi:hypothetical protein